MDCGLLTIFSRRFQLSHFQSVGGTNGGAETAARAIQGPRQPGQGAAHLQTEDRTNHHAIAAAGAAGKVKDRKLVNSHFSQ